jgi:predicted dehydrogenase
MKNLAIVGLGFWGKNLVGAVQGASEGVRFTVGVVRRPDASRSFAERRQLRLTTDYADALAAPDIDGIVLATPDSAHSAQVIAAARAGKPVLVEKPFSLDRASAERAIVAARECRTLVAFAHNRRFLPAVREIHTRIQSGALGKLLHIAGNFSSNYGLRFQEGMWRATRAESVAGGMTGMGIHQIDLMIHLAGRAKSVHAKGLRQVLTVDVDDNITMLLDFANGMTGTFTTLITTSPIWRLSVFGTKGWVEMIGENRLLVCEGNDPVHEIVYPPVNTERLEIEAFAQAIGGGAPYPVTVDEALHGVSVLESIAESVRTRQAVDIAP